MVKAKVKPPVYEDYNYLFFTVKYNCYTYRIYMEVYLGDRFLVGHEYLIRDGVLPSQEMLDARIENIIFDKLESLFTDKFAREDHEHQFRLK